MTPQNTRFLVCPNHLDPLNPQDAPIILSPDPEPVFNARPYPYTLSETSYLAAEDGDVLTTQDGVPLITPVPFNPDSPANVALLTAVLTYAAPSSLTAAYLDLFDGNPTAGGRSVLSAITGSSVRASVFDDLTLTNTNQTLVNADVITVSDGSESVTNVNYIGLYSASISGALITSGPVSVGQQTIGIDTVVQFNGLGLTIRTG